MHEGKLARRRQAWKIYRKIRQEWWPGLKSPCAEFNESIVAQLEAELLAAEKRAVKA